MLNIFKSQHRYTVFDEKTYGKLIKVLNGMTTYNVDSPERTKVIDYYYDNKDSLLEKNGLLLRKRVIGKKATLKIKRRFFDPQYFYTDNLRSHEREKEIPLHDSLDKHYFFLNNALNSMFSNNLQFDPDKLFEKMEVVMTLKIDQEKRNLFGYGGLKVWLIHEKFKVVNYKTNRKNETEVIQFRLVSPDNTLPLFDDLITRVERHCKEIFYTKDSKHEMAYKITKPLPSKEEQRKINEEIMKKRMMEESGEVSSSEETTSTNTNASK